MTYYDFDWNNEFDKYVQVDYSKYRAANDLELTPEQSILFYKLDKARDEYIKVTKERQEKAAKSFPPIFGINIGEISASFKMLYTIAVFAIIAAGIMYGLTKVQNKQKTPKKRKQK